MMMKSAIINHQAPDRYTETSQSHIHTCTARPCLYDKVSVRTNTVEVTG